MNNDEVEKNIKETIGLLGKVVIDNFKIINDRITELYEVIDELPIFELPKKPEPKRSTVGPGIIEKKDVDIEKAIAEKPKTKKVFENVKGDKLEFEFEEYENREGQKNSYVIYHKDSHQMVKYIGKSLIYNGEPDEEGFLYLKKGLGWVLDKDWVVKKA